MISFELDPLTLDQQAKVKGWLKSAESKLLFDCAVAQMNEHYFNAINRQENAESDSDTDKFNVQAKDELAKAKRIQTFISVLTYFASDEYSFHKLKVK